MAREGGREREPKNQGVISSHSMVTYGARDKGILEISHPGEVEPENLGLSARRATLTNTEKFDLARNYRSRPHHLSREPEKKWNVFAFGYQLPIRSDGFSTVSPRIIAGTN